MKEKVLRTVFRYVFEFMIAGFIGWLYEVITVWILWDCFENRGMLHMPIVPIYAVGAFMLLLVMGEKKRSPVYVFVFSAVITTVFELGASYLLEFIFKKQFWTYKSWWGSILDRSSVISSAIFGLFALIYFFGLHRISGRLSKKLPLSVCTVFSAAAVTAVLTDLVISVIQLLKKE